MGFHLLGLSLNFLAVGAAAACLLVFALLFSVWAEKRRSRRWLEMARQRPTGGVATHVRSRSSRRRRMTAGVVALIATCALVASLLLQDESIEVKAKSKVDEFPMRRVTSAERETKAMFRDLDEAGFSAISLNLTPPDMPVSTNAAGSNGLHIAAEIWPREEVVLVTQDSDPGPIESSVDREVDYRTPTLPSMPRKLEPLPESVLERYSFPR